MPSAKQKKRAQNKVYYQDKKGQKEQTKTFLGKIECDVGIMIDRDVASRKKRR